MKKPILFVLLTILMATIVSAVMVETGDRIYVECISNTTGVLTGSSARAECWDRAGNVDHNASMTNIETGLFYFTFSETDDRYYCLINCPSGAVDYIIPVLQGTVSDIDDILEDTSAQDTAGEWSNLMDLSSKTVGTCSVCSDVDAISANVITATAIADNAIDAGAIAASAIGSSEIATDAIGASEIAANAITSSEAPNLDAAISSRSSHSAADVWSVGTRTITGGTIDTVNDKTGYSLSTQDWTTDSDISAQNALLGQAISGNSSNIISTGNSNWATATGFSTHSASDVDNLISDEAIITAIKQNETTYFSPILADTNELQSNQNWNVWDDGTRTLTTADWTTDSDLVDVCYQSNLTDGIVALTSATETQIDNIETDTSSQDTSAEWLILMEDTLQNLTSDHGSGAWTTGAGGTCIAFSDANLTAVDNAISDEAIQTAIEGNASLWDNVADVSSLATTSLVQDVNISIINRGNTAWTTATGFSTHSAADVWTAGNRELSTPNNYKADVSNLALQTDLLAIGVDVNTSLANQNTLDNEVDEINTTTQKSLASLENNASNWFTSTYQNRIDADISSRSSHSATDVWSVGTRTLTSFGTLINDIVQAIFDGIIKISNKDLNETLGYVYNVTITQQNGLTANWSAIGSGTSPADVWSYADRQLTGLDEDNTSIDLDSTAVNASVSISAQDKKDIINQSIDCTSWASNSLACTIWAIETYGG